MAKSLEEMISSCAIFSGCSGVEALPSLWRDADGQLEKLVVFGYGSVIWKPGIEFEESHVGYIDGFVRRMWQGNETHRGRKGRPGRVATLIPKSNKRTYGKAFVLKSKEQIAAAMDHLIMREISLGGYCLGFTPFHRLDSDTSSLSSSSSSIASSSSASSFPSSPSSSSLSSMSEDEEGSIVSSFSSTSSSMPALVFSATSENDFYLGPSKMLSMAQTIADAEGPSGHNVEYLVKICDFMRDELPANIGDNHLFHLEKLTLQHMEAKGISYEPLAYPERFESQPMGAHCRSENISRQKTTQSFTPLSQPRVNYDHLGMSDASHNRVKDEYLLSDNQESDDSSFSDNQDYGDSLFCDNLGDDSVKSSVGMIEFEESDDTKKVFYHKNDKNDDDNNNNNINNKRSSSNPQNCVGIRRKSASKSKTEMRSNRRTGLTPDLFAPEL